MTVRFKGYADLKVQVNNIGTTVTNNKTAADNALANLRDSLDDLWDYAGDIDTEQGNSATWINQNKNKWQVVAASFNDNGSVKATGSVGLFVNDKLSTFSVNADRINFKTGDLSIKNLAGEITFSIDADGNVYIKGGVNATELVNSKTEVNLNNGGTSYIPDSSGDLVILRQMATIVGVGTSVYLPKASALWWRSCADHRCCRFYYGVLPGKQLLRLYKRSRTHTEEYGYRHEMGADKRRV